MFTARELPNQANDQHDDQRSASHRHDNCQQQRVVYCVRRWWQLGGYSHTQKWITMKQTQSIYLRQKCVRSAEQHMCPVAAFNHFWLPFSTFLVLSVSSSSFWVAWYNRQLETIPYLARFSKCEGSILWGHTTTGCDQWSRDVIGHRHVITGLAIHCASGLL